MRMNELHQKADEFATDGSGKLSTDNIQENEDGSIVVQIKDGEEKIPVTFIKNADGSHTPTLPDGYDEEDIERLTPKVNDATLSIGKIKKMQMLANQKEKEREERLTKLEADNRELRNAIKQTSTPEMSDEDAKKYFGKPTVSDVIEMMSDEPGKFLACNARYANSLAGNDVGAIVDQKVDERLAAQNAKEIKADNDYFKVTPLKSPKSVDTLGKTEQKPKKEVEKVSSFL